ncbi:MAG: PHP domain-containing protein [Clostridia bacterium]|nr:PHP domain-containing protein [Clostridia bacterium]
MFVHEKTYDIDELVLDNLHIHTRYSRCANREMHVRDIVRAADAAGLRTIALTDHNYIEKHNAVAAQRLKILKKLEKVPHEVRVLVGAELSSYGIGKFADDVECDNALDYRLYTTNHYHQHYWEHPAEKTPRAYAAHMLAIMDGVIESGRADCFAHPFMAGYVKAFDDFRDVTRAFTDNEIGDIMAKADAREIAWELNLPAVRDDPAFFRRYFHIGREVGVCFNIGTDAHVLERVNAKAFAEEYKQLLY